jgi:hypothetical protein
VFWKEGEDGTKGMKGQTAMRREMKEMGKECGRKKGRRDTEV